MKRTITIILSLVALMLVLASLAVSAKRHANVSEVYRRYKDRDNLSVAFVKDYRICDSITVDVTTITAKDSARWEMLLREIKMDESYINDMREDMRNGKYVVGSYYCKKGHPEIRTGLNIPDCDLVIVSPGDYQLFVFTITSKQQAHTIAISKRKEILHPYKKQQ